MARGRPGGGPAARVRRGAAGQDHHARSSAGRASPTRAGTAPPATRGTRRCTSGGSSGGRPAAVGLGMGAWSVGTDGGGSVRIPAAFTGTVALKPTYGLVPLYPPSPFGTLSHAGPMTRSVRRRGRDARHPHRLRPAGLVGACPPRPARSWPRCSTDGVLAGCGSRSRRGLGYVRNDPEVEAAVRAAVERAGRRRGPGRGGRPRLRRSRSTPSTCCGSPARPRCSRPTGPSGSTGSTRGCAGPPSRARGYSAADYLDATAVRMDLGRADGARSTGRTTCCSRRRCRSRRSRPGRTCRTAGRRRGWTSWTPYTYPFNLTQQPALSVPCGFTPAGLPVGLQIVGPRHADATRAAGRAGLPGPHRTGTPGSRRCASSADSRGRDDSMARYITVSLDIARRVAAAPCCWTTRRRAPRRRCGTRCPSPGRSIHGKYARNEIYNLVPAFAARPSRARRTPRSPRSPATLLLRLRRRRPGQPGLRLRGRGGAAGQAAVVDLALFYGRNNLLINGDQGWVPGNVFGTVVDGLAEMAAACQDIWMGGARGETLTFARAE